MDPATSRNEQTNLGSLLIETGATVASLILFPALAQSLKVSPTLVGAVKIAMRNLEGKK